MRAAAKLRRKVANLHHAHPVAILLAEQRHRVVAHSRPHRSAHPPASPPSCSPAPAVHDRLNLRSSSSATPQSAKSRTAAARGRSATRLLHMRPQHLAQRRMQQMRPRMVAHRSPPHLAVDNRVHYRPPQSSASPPPDAQTRPAPAWSPRSHRQPPCCDRPHTASPHRPPARPSPHRSWSHPAPPRPLSPAATPEHPRHPSPAPAPAPHPPAAPSTPQTPSSAARDTPAPPTSATHPSTKPAPALLLFLRLLETLHVEFNASIARSIDHEVQRQAKGLVEIESKKPL
jgi:hypothetical protein